MTSTIPFKILFIDDNSFHLIVKIKVNGKSFNFILDTGASRTVMDLSQIRKLSKTKIKSDLQSITSGVSKHKIKNYTTVLNKIQIGEVGLIDYECILLDLAHVNKLYKQAGFKPVMGILGSDILLAFQVVIDYGKETLKLKMDVSPLKKSTKK